MSFTDGGYLDPRALPAAPAAGAAGVRPAEIAETWNLIIPVDDRPDKPQHDYDVENMFSVTLRDTGEVAIIDGDSKDIISIIKTGYAVHISRLSASGRYVYTIGRDAKVDMIDLYMDPPAESGRDPGRARSPIGGDLQVQGLRGQVRGRRILLAAAVRHHGRLHRWSR